MKRQPGAVWAAGMLLCASLAWSQNSGTSSSQTGSTSSSQSLFTNSTPSAWSDATQNGSGDPGQSGGGTGTDNTSQTGAIGPQDTFTHPEQLPALDLFSDAISHTGISLSTFVGSGAQYVSTEGIPGYWDGLSNFGAGITVAQSRPTYGWVVGYNGGTTLTSGVSNYNETYLNQSASANLVWDFAKRWQLRVTDSYGYSADPFQPFLTFLGQPTPNNPNPVLYYPQSVVEGNTARLDLTYELGPHDIVNFGFGENFQRYLEGAVSSLYNSVSYSESAFYQHEFSKRLSLGGGYSFAALDFGHGESRAGVNTFQGFISYEFSSRLQASLWLGPELTGTKDIVPLFCEPGGCFVETQHASSWSVAEGGTLRWRISPVDQLSVNVSRGVSNAGGILGAADIYQVIALYGRPISRVWNFGVAANYSSSTSVSPLRAAEYLRSTTGTVGVSRRLFNDAWNLNAYYAFIHQKQNYVLLPVTTATSGFGVTVRYTWNHGLGR